MVEYVLVTPVFTRFRLLIDYATSGDILVHQAPNVPQSNTAQFSPNPPMRLFRQLKLNVVSNAPIAERILVREEAIWVS